MSRRMGSRARLKAARRRKAKPADKYDQARKRGGKPTSRTATA